MIIQARFGSAQTGLGYQFYSASGALLGSRVTSGIVSLPETGSYAADATVPANAVGVFWDSATSQASEDLREALAPAPDNTAVLDAIAALPTEEEIIAAAGGLSVEAAAALEAADQILLVDLYTPAAGPELVIPAPATDESLTVVYAYTESITNTPRAGIVLTYKLVTTPAKSERLLEVAPATATTDANGYAQVTLQSGLRYRVTSRELGLEKTFTPTGATFDLLTLIP